MGSPGEAEETETLNIKNILKSKMILITLLHWVWQYYDVLNYQALLKFIGRMLFYAFSENYMTLSST